MEVTSHWARTTCNAHRSKVGGLIGALRHWDYLSQNHNLVDVEVEVRCDGLEAIQNAKHSSDPTKLNIGHFDLVSTLRKVILSLPSEVKFNHAKGHRDDVSKNLSLWEKLNVMVDLRAKMALWEVINGEKSQPPFHSHSSAHRPISIQRAEYSSSRKAIAREYDSENSIR